MAEETEEQSELDNGFDVAWFSGAACRLAEMRARSRAWVTGYESGRTLREDQQSWGDSGGVYGPSHAPPFCPLAGR